MRVLNFGSLNPDHVYQVEHFVAPGETLSAGSQTVNCGGNRESRGHHRGRGGGLRSGEG